MDANIITDIKRVATEYFDHQGSVAMADQPQARWVDGPGCYLNCIKKKRERELEGKRLISAAVIHRVTGHWLRRH